MDNLPPRFIGIAVAGVTCGILTLASYNPRSKTPDHVQAKIKNIGGGPTPLDGFFLGLGLELNTRGRIKTARRKVWVSYTTSEGEETHVAISRNNSGQWLITSIRGQDWGV